MTTDWKIVRLKEDTKERIKMHMKFVDTYDDFVNVLLDSFEKINGKNKK